MKRNPSRAQIDREFAKENAKRQIMGMPALTKADFVWRWYPEWFKSKSNPRAKKMTKLQRMNASSKRSKQKRIAKALRAYVDAQYGPGKVTEVRVRKNSGGSSTIIPVRRRRTR